jgi:Phage integrase family
MAHKERQVKERTAAGGQWSAHDPVFATRTGGTLDAANVRREFKAACKAAKIGEHWTPRELRHSFVSLMSSSGVPVEEIARLTGHSNTRTTEVVYRRELRPILTTGAEAMDRIFQSPTSPLRQWTPTGVSTQIKVALDAPLAIAPSWHRVRLEAFEQDLAARRGSHRRAGKR